MIQKSVLNVLLAEDDPVTASTITSVLTGLGWTVDFAASGKAAVRLQQQGNYDVILLDDTLPDMSGEQVYRAIKMADNRVPPVLFLRNSEAQNGKIVLEDGDQMLPDVSDIKDMISRCHALAATAPAMAISA
ncbi:response regulator [Salinimonas iocasae]|nr:response regulator [Salinimonas iocasae]